MLEMQGQFNNQKRVNIIKHINRVKDKDYMTVLTDTEKAFYQIQQLFMIKSLNKLKINENVLSIINGLDENLQLISYSMIKD